MENAVPMILSEGCFSLQLSENSQYSFNIQVMPKFHINMHDKEEELLRILKAKLNIGIINLYSDTAIWTVRTIDDCDKLEQYIEENAGILWKASTKSRSYKIWKGLRQDRKQLMQTKQGMKRLIRIGCAINQNNRKKDWIAIIENSQK